MSYVMGIDIGTYESKGVLVDQKGHLLVHASISHQLEIPKRGWVEHDAEQVWWHDFTYLSKVLIHEAKKKYGIVASEIVAVGASSIAPAIVPVDVRGKALRKAILYGIDTRSVNEIAYLNQVIGEEKIYQIAGHYLSSQSAGPKILWIRNEEPTVYEGTHKFLCGSGYIVYKLTGEHIIDRYTAAAYSPLFNIQKLDWDPPMTQMIAEMDKLPRLAWGHEVVGEVTKNAAIMTGLVPGTKVIAGTADALSESISVGAVTIGDLMLMYGSSTFFILVSKVLSETKTLWPSVHAVPELKTITGGTATAGSITRWFVEQWMGELEETRGENLKHRIDLVYTHLAQLAEQSVPGSNGLITLPYFSGERTPIHNPMAKGVFFGLSLHHTRQDMYRSILEGIAFSIRHNIDEMQSLGMSINRVIAVGGGVKNRLWLQSVSDICQINQVIPEITIGASYGNAFLCALGLGWYDEVGNIDQWVKVKYEIESKETHKELYQRYYKLYHKLYQQTKELMNEL